MYSSSESDIADSPQYWIRTRTFTQRQEAVQQLSQQTEGQLDIAQESSSTNINIYPLQQNLVGRRFAIQSQQQPTQQQRAVTEQPVQSQRILQQSDPASEVINSNPPQQQRFNMDIKISLKPPNRYNGNPATLDLWLYSLKIYFGACGLDHNRDDSDKCASIAAALLDGPALQWHHRLSLQNSVPQDFATFQQVITNQFGVMDKERRARDDLKTIKQTSSVSEYIKRFEQVVMYLPTASQDELVHAFTYGLHASVRKYVLLNRPATLNEAQTSALLIDDRSIQSSHKGNAASSNYTADTSVPMEIGNMRKGRRNGNRRFNNQKQSKYQASKGKQNATANRPKQASNWPQRNGKGKRPTRPCRHCGEQHWDNDCPRVKQQFHAMPMLGYQQAPQVPLLTMQPANQSQQLVTAAQANALQAQLNALNIQEARS